jgi:hypothetical protein
MSSKVEKAYKIINVIEMRTQNYDHQAYRKQ